MPSDEDVSGGNPGDMFVWMSKEHLCVLVYVVTVMHSMQAGYMDKAQKYTEKAFLQIEKLKRKSSLLLQPTNGNNILFFSQ
jgi:MAternally-affected-uncoordination protein